MAWDGIIWIKLRRQLTDEEKARQIKVDVIASSKAQDDYSVFEMNDAWLEMANSAYRQRGLLTYGCIPIFATGIAFIIAMIWAILNPPSNLRGI